jgi:hypothetical protein
MSVAAMNWALRQRLASPQQQILLYVIADSADPDGVTRFCNPDYMEKHARMTRATMFRRLGELEDLGLLQRLKFYSDRGAPIYEIRLSFGVLIDLPIYRRKPGSEEIEEETEVAAEAENARPKSQGETLVEPTKVPCSAGPESHSCDFISPPSSEESPPNPPPGGAISKKEREQSEKRADLWRRFAASYPSIAAMDQQLAQAELDTLSIDDAEWAVSVLPDLKEELRKAQNRPPKNAHLWLRKGMFRNFARRRISEPTSEGIWVAEGSDEDRALRFVRGLARAINPMVLQRPDGSRGYPRRAPVGPDLLAMLAFVDDIPLRWPAFERGGPEFAAWQSRFVTWTGQAVPIPPGENSIRAPCRWPPKKDGTIYQDDDLDVLASEGTR